MDKILKDFEDKSNIEIIKEIMKSHNGYIMSKELDMFNIHRMYLSIMQDKGIIERVAPGIYMDSNKLQDNYYIFSLSMPSVVFSHMTALYFYGLSIKAPDEKYEVTVKRTYNNHKLQDHEVFYVDNNIYNLGISEVKTPLGNTVKAYDIERCICDIIRSKKRMDPEYIKYSVKQYLKRKNKNIIKLSEYAKIMGIHEQVMEYITLMHD